MTHEEIVERRKKIFEMRESGMTYKAIANIYGVTQARIQQIYDKQKRINEYEAMGSPAMYNNKQWGYYK